MNYVQMVTLEKSTGSTIFDKKIDEKILFFASSNKQIKSLLFDFIEEKKYKRLGYNDEYNYYWARNDGKIKFDFKIKYIKSST